MATASHLDLNKSMGNEEFPILCKTCLGPNPMVRMTMERWGKGCKICERPFTVYKWKPGPQSRFKATELCYTCAKMKNVCQTCVLDLKYGLPVQVIESVMRRADLMPQTVSKPGQRYQMEQVERDLNRGNFQEYSQAQHEVLEQLARRQPYYKRNDVKLCSFYARGECNRGEDCPFRHEMPKPEGPLSHQNIRDRYAGKNDPVAERMLARVRGAGRGGEGGSGGGGGGGGGHPGHLPRLMPPEDPTITTLFVAGLDSSVTETDLRVIFEEHAPVKQIRMVPNKNFAFVCLASRIGAEKAARELHNNVSIRGVPLRLAWGKRRAGPADKGDAAAGPGVVNPDSVAHLQMPSAAALPVDGLPPPGGKPGALVYPSQDPRNFAARLDQ